MVVKVLRVVRAAATVRSETVDLAGRRQNCRPLVSFDQGTVCCG
jgi:hypothetical protein